jgi:hypothetical protein
MTIPPGPARHIICSRWRSGIAENSLPRLTVLALMHDDAAWIDEKYENSVFHGK